MMYGDKARKLLSQFDKACKIAIFTTGLPDDVAERMGYIIVNYHPKYRKYIGYCERCEFETQDNSYTYCPKCGTHLDW